MRNTISIKASMLVIATILCGLAFEVQAQTTSVFTTGLNHPNKIINSADNTMLVSESGRLDAPNTGRISIVNRSTGSRQTLINGLPSGINTLPPAAPETAGPSGLFLHGHTLFVTISAGDSVQRGGGGIELENPTGGSSPIFISVLEIVLPGGYHNLTSPFSLQLADHTTLANSGLVTLTNADGQTLLIRMIVNLPNSVPNPRPGVPLNRRQSNLFGVERFQKDLYVNDASFNLIYRIEIESGDATVFTTFAPKVNPLFPFGPPTVEAVPDSIQRVGNQLLVTYLTGFPFGPDVAEVRTVSLKDASQATLIPGLRSAIDSLHVDNPDGSVSYYTLEYSANMLVPLPGILKYFATADAPPLVVTNTLLAPTSMVRDDATGDIFVTNIFLGTITLVDLP